MACLDIIYSQITHLQETDGAHLQRGVAGWAGKQPCWSTGPHQALLAQIWLPACHAE